MKKDTWLLLNFMILKIALQYLIVHPDYDLQRDEYLHLDQARHLAWGYESVPPFTSWVSWLILQLGNSEAAVKFFPALFGALTLFFTWKIAEALNGGLFAKTVCATAVLLSTLLRLNMLFQPNSFDVLCWTALVFGLLAYVKRASPEWLYFGAAVFALGFLNKYNIVFLLPGLALGLLLTEHRTIFFQKHLWLAAALALILICPNLFWQWENGWPVLRHMQELARTQLVNVSRGDFAKEQLIFFYNSIFLIVAGLFSFISYKPHRTYRMFLISTIATLLLFVYFRAKGYYAFGLYPALIAFGAVYVEHLTSKPRLNWLRIASFIIIGVLFGIGARDFLPLTAPPKPGTVSTKTHRWEDGIMYPIEQDFADMLGWRELAAKTDRAYDSIQTGKNILVLCDNYGQAGAINFYSKKNLRAVSFNADYINWFDLSKPIEACVRITEEGDSDLDQERAAFGHVQVYDSITTPFAREKGTRIIVSDSAIVDLNAIIREEIKQEKRETD